MDYQKIYNLIIERGKSRSLDGYKEIHHITPRCMGGSNCAENLVELTAREHFLCHKLLCEIYPENDKLVWGYWVMAKMRGHKQKRSYGISAREYERLRKKYCEVLKKRVPWNKGLTKDDPRVAKYATTPRWNKGLTKHTDSRVADHASNAHASLKGRKRPSHSDFMKLRHQKKSK